MQLVIVRHAEAASGEPDDLRPLTPSGRDVARSLGQQLARDGVQPSAVLSSPLLRARETAEELARPAGIEAEPDERLAPGATPEGVRAAAEERGGTVIVVAHQPDCSRIAAALTGGEEPPFAPGAMLSIEL